MKRTKYTAEFKSEAVKQVVDKDQDRQAAATTANDTKRHRTN